MTNTQGPFGASRRMSFPNPPTGDVITTYDSYEGAQQAVDRLAHADFPVERASIVGNDMKSVERCPGGARRAPARRPACGWVCSSASSP